MERNKLDSVGIQDGLVWTLLAITLISCYQVSLKGFLWSLLVVIANKEWLWVFVYMCAPKKYNCNFRPVKKKSSAVRHTHTDSPCSCKSASYQRCAVFGDRWRGRLEWQRSRHSGRPTAGVGRPGRAGLSTVLTDPWWLRGRRGRLFVRRGWRRLQRLVQEIYCLGFLTGIRRTKTQ